MKRISIRSMAFMLVFVLMINCCVFTALATNEATIAVQSVTAQPGKSVDVAVMITHNSGIAGMTLDVDYDKNALTLTAVKDGGILGSNTHKPELTSPYTLSWSNDTIMNNITANGTIATLTFEVKENVDAGDYPITLSYDYENYDIYDVDIQAVLFKTVNGTITVREEISDVLIGDINNDGKINGADAGVLSRYTSGWKGYADKIKNMAAADINGDGNVNGADAGILSRHVSGWTQYDKYFN
ncbi:MAG: cohesin domain-containing protein [Ruminococcus sp.]|nr:cohesin domain-containing protein [Ruminococcus sp.]